MLSWYTTKQKQLQNLFIYFSMSAKIFVLIASTGFFLKPSSLLYLFSIKRLLHYIELFSTAYLLVFFIVEKKGIEWHLLVNCARYFCCYTLHMILLHKLFRTHDFLYCACHVFDTILLIEKKKLKQYYLEILFLSIMKI